LILPFCGLLVPFTNFQVHNWKSNALFHLASEYFQWYFSTHNYRTATGGCDCLKKENVLKLKRNSQKEYNIPDTDGLLEMREEQALFLQFHWTNKAPKIYVRYYRRVNKFGRLVADRIAQFHIIFRFETKMWHKQWHECTATFTRPLAQLHGKLQCQLGHGGKVIRDLTHICNTTCYKHRVSNTVSTVADGIVCCSYHSCLCNCTMMSTLLLYTRISLFSMIFNIHATFGSIIRLGQYVGCVSNHWQFTRCHSDHFRPFSMISDVFTEFPMFAHLYLTYRYIDGLSMHSPYYSIPI